ncbi:MAG: signal peptidase [Solirubrobacteraceae bacterium]|nr:signal peptidase [Solirubrobacteraceae bacterium]
MAAVFVAGPTGAASPDDPAGVPFLTMAHALAAGDYTLACAQLSTGALREAAPAIADSAARRSACVTAFADEQIDRGRFDSTRIVKVRVKPGRARVTVQTTFHDLQPRATGTAVMEDGAWKIRETPTGAHVGSLLLFRIPSEGMIPTLAVGDTALVDDDAYLHARPRLGDVVVFRAPAGAGSARECGKRPPHGQACAIATPRDASLQFIKRIVAGPGDRISIRDGRVLRNGRRAAEPFITPCDRAAAYCDYPRTFTVAAGRYYVLGDNRGASDDSRFWGPVARRALVGRVARVIARDAPS